MKGFNLFLVLVLSLALPVAAHAELISALFLGLAAAKQIGHAKRTKRAMQIDAQFKKRAADWHDRVLNQASQPPKGWWALTKSGKKIWIPNEAPLDGVFSLPTRQYGVRDGQLVPLGAPEGE